MKAQNIKWFGYVMRTDREFKGGGQVKTNREETTGTSKESGDRRNKAELREIRITNWEERVQNEKSGRKYRRRQKLLKSCDTKR